jgi:hypothetical protein
MIAIDRPDAREWRSRRLQAIRRGPAPHWPCGRCKPGGFHCKASSAALPWSDHRRFSCQERQRSATQTKRRPARLGRSSVTSTALNDYCRPARTCRMMVWARLSPVPAPLRSIAPPVVPPVPVSPTLTPPPSALEFETPPFPLSAFLWADAAPRNTDEAIAAIARPLMSFCIGSRSSPLTLCLPLARKRASRPEPRRASATPRHAATT